METLIEDELESLAAKIRGVVASRGSSEYQAEVDGYNSAGTFAPDIVVGAVDEADVQQAVRYAAAKNMNIVVQATGHGNYAPVTGGLLVNTRRMRNIVIDASSRSATLGAGVVWGDLQPHLAPLGLAAVSGSSPSVSAVGLTLGGGLGPLSRTLGCTVDYVESFRIVDGKGNVREVNAERDPELFWALRGGKVGLGIVTEMRLRLVELPVIYGGSLYWDGPNIEKVLRAWVEWTATAPEEVNSSVNILRLPDLEDVPQELRGRTIIHLRYAYVPSGAASDELAIRGEEWLTRFRSIGTPLIDTIGVMPTTKAGTIHSDPPGPLLVWERGTFLNQVDQDYATELLDIVGEGQDAPFIAVETRHFGGAIARNQEETAMGGRDAAYSLFLIGMPVAELFDTVLPELADRIFNAINDYIHPLTNYHWAGHPTGAGFERLWSARQHERLTAVRSAVDPKGLFTYEKRQHSEEGASYDLPTPR